MEYRITTDLTTEPVTLEEAKAQIVADYTADDDLITAKIKTARQWLEQYTGLAFGEKTIQAYYDYLDEEYALPIGPIIGNVTSITRTVNGVDTVLTTSDYWITGLNYPVFSFGQVWTSCGRSKTSYSIIYQAGYNDSNPLPSPIKEAILKLTAELYRDRENTITGAVNSVSMIPHNVRALVSPYRRNVLI